MRTTSSVCTRSANCRPRRVLKCGKQPERLPIPGNLRQQLKVEAWRDKIWQAKHKELALLHPQFRELIRKMQWSMARVGMHEMALNLLLALFITYTFTGSVAKLQEFIEAVWNGHVFLVDLRPLGLKNIVPNLPGAELLKRLCLYFPHTEEPLPEERLKHAKTFAEFLGPIPSERPWMAEWDAELKALRSQMVTELGEQLAAELWAGTNTTRKPGDAGETPEPKRPRDIDKRAYW